MLRSLPTSLLLLLAGTAACAQTPPPAEPVVVPQVDRRDVQPARLPSNDFSVSLFAGAYATENFGTSAVAGARLGYHITENVFVEATYGQTTVSDEAFRQILPGGGILGTPTQKLSYYNLSAAYNVLTGEAFFGRNNARASALYVIGGIGSTKFVDQSQQTFNFGFGTRLMLNDRFSVQADVRDHVFSLDLLGKRQSTQNLEISLGLSIFF
jgi:outer membrane beta-barrel protein